MTTGSVSVPFTRNIVESGVKHTKESHLHHLEDFEFLHFYIFVTYLCNYSDAFINSHQTKSCYICHNKFLKKPR